MRDLPRDNHIFCWQFYFESQTKIRFEVIKTKTIWWSFVFPRLCCLAVVSSLECFSPSGIWSFSKRNIVWLLSKPLHFWWVLKSISKSATFFLLWKKENASSPGPKIPKIKIYSGLSSLLILYLLTYCAKHYTLVFLSGNLRPLFAYFSVLILNILFESFVNFFSLFTGFFALIVYNLSIGPRILIAAYTTDYTNEIWLTTDETSFA